MYLYNISALYSSKVQLEKAVQQYVHRESCLGIKQEFDYAPYRRYDFNVDFGNLKCGLELDGYVMIVAISIGMVGFLFALPNAAMGFALLVLFPLVG